MTDKRFISKDESIINVVTDELVNASSEEGAEILVDWLTELSDKYTEQRKENYGLLDGIAFYKEENASLSERISDLECENEQLKQQKARYKRLSEIRNEEINNRILTIKEFIDNCSNEKVKKALEDLFYSEVNEYDLSKKYRKLHEENEDLKEYNAILKQALTRLVEAYYDKYMKQWSVRDTGTFVMYPCTSKNMANEFTKLLNELYEENKEFKSALVELKEIGDYQYSRIKELSEENEQLKQQLDEIKTYDKEEFTEAEYINDIYKEKGFCGVIAYAKDKLQYYGVVKEVEKGLWIMVSGGWSDNEFWLSCLNNPISIFGMKHYRGYLRGGAFYYTEKPRGDVEIILKGDKE